jgi:exopolysaccharide production protein ExoZ
MKATPSGNLIAIQILRCVAALLVVVWHSQLSIKLFTRNYWSEGDSLFRALHFPSFANHLSVGVDIFFCISGFIMSMLAARTKSANAGSFIVDRFVRILPPYWLFTTIVIAVYLVNPGFNFGEFTGEAGQDAVRIVESFLLAPQDKNPVLGVGWTLVHEFLFYYLVALLIFLKQGQRVAAFLAAAAGVGVLLCLDGANPFYGYGLSPYYVEFFAGALAYRIYERTSSIYPEAQCAIAVSLYFGVSAVLDAFQASTSHMLIQVFGFGLVGFLLISGIMGVDAKYELTKFSAARLLARVGDASYSLYLSHWFVLSSIGKIAVLFSDAPVYLVAIWQVAAIASAVLFAVLFAEYVELPFHRRLLNHLKCRRKKAAIVAPTL